MKLSFLATYLLALLLSMSSAWRLQANSLDISGKLPHGCKSINIPGGSKIKWTPSSGARTLQLFNVQGKCTDVHGSLTGDGEFSSSDTIFGYIVKP